MFLSFFLTCLLTSSAFLSVNKIYSQYVGANCFAQGNFVEIGIQGSGGYEGAPLPNPGGYHYRSGNPTFGFVSNPQMNGWASFDGDFFTPGSPENGWGIEIIDGGTNLVASNNCATGTEINGSITGYLVSGQCRVITWDGDYINGIYNVHIKIDYVIMMNDLFYTTVVTLTNNGANIPDFYYYRNFDPDNNQSISGDFTTQNTIVSQPGSGCDKAHVRATSNLPGTQPMSYVGLAGVGANWRCIYGGFSNRDASDIWNAAGFGFVGTTGSTNFQDEAIALAYRHQNFASGSTQQLRFVVILDDAASNSAVANLFSVTWPGAPPSLSTVCNPVTDTVTICNGGSANLSVTGTALGSFNWTWSPAIGLSSTTGTTVTASPTSNQLYTVTGTPTNPCFNTVTQQIFVRVVPGTTTANAGPNQTLTCTNTTVTLTGSTGSPSPTFSWSGPGGVSSVTTPNINVNTPGVYTLTVTSGSCSVTDTVAVFSNTVPPNANGGPDQSLTCITTSVPLSGSSTTAGATALWTGPGIVSGANTFTPTVNTAGNYTVTITDPVNGCTSTDVVTVNINNTPPNSNAGPDMALTCAITSINLAGSSTTPGATFSWTGPGILSGGTTATPNVNVAGNYTVTITDPVNGCTATDVAAVTGSTVVPNANAGIDMTLTCTVTSLNLAGSSSTPGATFVWSGPGITAGGTTATPTINAVGNYTVTVTNPANGCTSTDVASVTINNTPPNVNAGADALLNCTITSVNLSGSSSTGGATFAWTGPSITAGAATATATVNGPGNYTLTVTNPANGCIATDVATVTQNIVAPNANAGLDATLTCTTTSLNLSGSSSTGGATFVWSGPGVTGGANTSTPTINAVGNYTITVTDPSNGCTSTDVATVNINNVAPNANAGIDQVLSCTVTNINLAGSSATGGATFSWSGPGIVSGGTTATPNVNAVGNYTVTVTDPVNGCTSTDVAAVTLNGTLPNANAGADQILNCIVTTLNMAGSSSTGGVTFAWTGPSITAGATTATPTVNGPGTYTVTVTNPINGCTNTDVAIVTQNITPPNSNAGPDGVLNCVVTTLNLSGSSSTGGVTFAWAGPSITAGAATATPTVNGPGTYTITVTDPVNGCTSTDQTLVTLNNTLPNANAGADAVLNCTITLLNLTGSSTTGGATFAWAGPSITSGGTTATPAINGPGTYTITVTDPSNGCTSTDQAIVTQNIVAPNANAGPDQILNCTITNVNMAGSSTTGGVTFAWTGPSIVSGANTNTPNVNGAGTYTITVTDPTNGCTSTDQAVVNMNGVLPNANAGVDQILNCTVTSLNMAGSSTTGGVTFAWSGPSITAGGTTSTPTIDAPGTYTVLVTDPSNGCTSTDVADVAQNITPPGANAGIDDILNCLVTDLNLSGSATAPGATYSWTGPSIVSGGTTATPNVNGPGSYTVITTDPVNGCTSTDIVDITLNNTAPDLSMGVNQNILCNTPMVNLTSSSTTAGVSYSWSGPGMVGSTTADNVNANAPGTYTIVVTDPVNGCTSTGTVDAILDLNFPTANFAGDNLASCAPLCVNLSDQSAINGSPITQWNWNIESQGTATTPGGTFCFNDPGTYDVTLTVTTSDGCTSTLTIPNYLTVYPNPDADFMYSPQEITEFDPLVVFGNTTTGGNSYLWDFGDGSNSTDLSPQHLYGDTGTFCVTLLATTNFGCTDTVTHCLFVAPEFLVYIPNTFTANDDGLNEIWSVVARGVKTFEARIFNRWGEEIFFFDSLDKGWNGNKQNGQECQQDVYVYRVAIQDFKGDYHEYYGNINLVR